MPIASLFLTLILTNFLSFTDCKPIESQNVQSNVNGAPEGPKKFANDNIKLANKVEQLSGSVDNNNTCSGNCNEKNANILSEFKQPCPYESKELCLIFSLSKIANVQVATLSGTPTNRNLKSNTFGGEEFREKNLHDSFAWRNGDEYFKSFSRKHVESTNIHCRAIQDVYIPEAEQNLPAFACQLGNNTFILSSERFLQDRRLYLDIRVDENTFKNIKHTPKVSRSSEYNAIPALLILNAANNGYTVEMHKSISHEGNQPRSSGKRSIRNLSNDYRNCVECSNIR